MLLILAEANAFNTTSSGSQQVPVTRYLLPGTCYEAPGIGHQVPGIYLLPGMARNTNKPPSEQCSELTFDGSYDAAFNVK